MGNRPSSGGAGKKGKLKNTDKQDTISVPGSTTNNESSKTTAATRNETWQPPPAFQYEKGTCALEWWEPISLLGEGSISDIHLVVRRKKRVHVRYKEKRNVMQLAKQGKGSAVAPNEPVFALKSIHKDHVGNERVLEEMRREIYTMSRLDHPNIVKLYEAYERRRHIYLVMEYCPGGNLADRHFAENECASIIRKILSAVAYMHSKRVVHRDLKLENIVFARNMEPKIIDFGLATKYLSQEYKNMTDRVGTLYSMAPQVLQGVYTSKCDMWSIGVIAYILLSGHQPFWGPPRPMPWVERRSVMIDRIMRCQYMRMDWPDVSDLAKEFCASLLRLDPDERPTAKQALKHPWIAHASAGETTTAATTTTGVSLDDSKYQLALRFQKNARELLTSKLSEKQVLSLRQALENCGATKEGSICLGDFRRVLEEEAPGLSAQDVAFLFHDVEDDETFFIHFQDLLARVLEDKSRSTIASVAKALDDKDEEGTRLVPRDDIRSIVEQHISDDVKAEVLDEIETNADDLVSTVQVLEVLGRKLARHTRDSVRSSAGREDSENDDLVDERNAKIPGGHLDPSTQPKFVYSPIQKSLHKVQISS